jgi:NAD(P)-dependent dehydrogenase (short-subunit alcohol dehydrogenase family)
MPTVLITGAGRGLGLEFARQYAAEGWKVIGTIRDPGAREMLAAAGADIRAQVLDVTDRAALARLAADLKGDPIDVLVCNAGIMGPSGASLGKIDYAAWEQVLRVNVLGAAAAAEAFAENVAASRQKIIAMISSRLGSVGEAYRAEYLYGPSKAALNAFSRALSIGLAERGVTVVALSPGWVRTDMGGKSAPLAPETSVSGMRKVIEGLTSKQSGRFLNYDGSDIPW